MFPQIVNCVLTELCFERCRLSSVLLWKFISLAYWVVVSLGYGDFVNHILMKRRVFSFFISLKLLSNCWIVCVSSEKMASTFTATSSIGSMVAPNGHKSDMKLINKLSSSSFGRRQSVCPRPRRSSSAIVCAAKELHFNKDGTTIRRLQVSTCFFL